MKDQRVGGLGCCGRHMEENVPAQPDYPGNRDFARTEEKK